MQVTQLWAQSFTAIIGVLACELLHWYSLSRKPGALELTLDAEMPAKTMNVFDRLGRDQCVVDRVL